MATLNEKKAKIQQLLDTNDRAVCKALETIFDRQTPDEKQTKTTTNLNNRGFSYKDAAFGSSLGGKVKMGWTLTPKQLSAGRRMIKHYWKQLIEVADLKTPGWADPKPALHEMTPVAVDVTDMEFKVQFAEIEKKQEEAAFMSDPDFKVVDVTPPQMTLNMDLRNMGF